MFDDAVTSGLIQLTNFKILRSSHTLKENPFHQSGTNRWLILSMVRLGYHVAVVAVFVRHFYVFDTNGSCSLSPRFASSFQAKILLFSLCFETIQRRGVLGGSAVAFRAALPQE